MTLKIKGKLNTKKIPGKANKKIMTLDKKNVLNLIFYNTKIQNIKIQPHIIVLYKRLKT